MGQGTSRRAPWDWLGEKCPDKRQARAERRSKERAYAGTMFRIRCKVRCGGKSRPRSRPHGCLNKRIGTTTSFVRRRSHHRQQS